MSEIDYFASQLLEEAKRFLEKAKLECNPDGKDAYLHASLLLSVSSLEAHINAIADEKLIIQDLEMLEKSILSEKEFTLIDGKFELTERLKMYRMIERIEFIYRKFAHTIINKEEVTWWGPVNEAINKRNAFVHAKDHLELSEKDVEVAILNILELLNSIYNALYKTNYPAYGRKLDSKMVF